MSKSADTDNVDHTGLHEPLSDPVIYDVSAYISESYARTERDKLWRKVWQQVDRVEDIPDVGDYITYDILEDSILIVRTGADSIRAYHNVCQHRGRRLVDTAHGSGSARGKARQFACRYHGWRWNINGENIYILDKEDWRGCLTKENTRLAEVKVDVWGGWIWINMDPDCEPLHEYLEPAAGMLDPFQLERMRYRWRRWAVFDCNWKVAMEAFSEAYHVEATHPQFMKFGVFTGWAKVQGIHSQMGYDPPKGLDGGQNKLRLGAGDPRLSTAEMQIYAWERTDGTITTKTLVEAAKRLPDELPKGTPPGEVLKHWLESARRDDAARGVIWPTVDPEHAAKAGNAWQIFPNFQIGHALSSALCYRARPYGGDPNKCLFEASVIELYPPNTAPKTAWIHTPDGDPAWLEALPQDFSNLVGVQSGMKSLGFRGPRPNPKQERAVSALHRTLARYMGTGAPYPIK
jgi:nitrite reductase/ring-hydroxylating ferredoxin subunit